MGRLKSAGRSSSAALKACDCATATLQSGPCHRPPRLLHLHHGRVPVLYDVCPALKPANSRANSAWQQRLVALLRGVHNRREHRLVLRLLAHLGRDRLLGPVERGRTLGYAAHLKGAQSHWHQTRAQATLAPPCMHKSRCAPCGSTGYFCVRSCCGVLPCGPTRLKSIRTVAVPP